MGEWEGRKGHRPQDKEKALEEEENSPASTPVPDGTVITPRPFQADCGGPTRRHIKKRNGVCGARKHNLLFRVIAQSCRILRGFVRKLGHIFPAQTGKSPASLSLRWPVYLLIGRIGMGESVYCTGGGLYSEVDGHSGKNGVTWLR